MSTYHHAIGVLAMMAAGMLLSGCGPDDKAAQSETPLELEDLKGGAVEAMAAIDRARVFLTVRTDCPIANRYAPEIAAIATEFDGSGIDFRLVYVDVTETPEKILLHRDEYGLSIPALRDLKLDFVRWSGATVTPEAIVVAGDGRILYRGRIDDRAVDFGKWRAEAGKRDLREMLERVRAGDTFEGVTVTKAVGCYIEGAENGGFE